MLDRLAGKYRRTVSARFFRRMITMKPQGPIISFSFDDAPLTAFTIGGDIMKSHGVRATYYVSLGLLGAETISGTIARADDLRRAAAEGHELGCHTFNHSDSWHTTTDKFEQSIFMNRHRLADILPDISFRSFAYPKNEPKPLTKSIAGKHFLCCRGGGQACNIGRADLNMLKACFLDVRNRDNIESVKRLIDDNVSHQGWLIFATHDVADKPSQYGCTEKYLTEVVTYALHSGAVIVPVAEGCEKIQK